MDKSEAPGHMGDHFSLMVLNIFSIIKFFFLLGTKICVSVYVH
jgi:hypothetical protein